MDALYKVFRKPFVIAEQAPRGYDSPGFAQRMFAWASESGVGERLDTQTEPTGLTRTGNCRNMVESRHSPYWRRAK